MSKLASVTLNVEWLLLRHKTMRREPEPFSHVNVGQGRQINKKEEL